MNKGNLPGRRKNDRQQIRNGHGHQYHICRCSHVSFTQDDDDQDVREKRDKENTGHDEAIDGDGQGWRPIPGRAVDVITVAFVPTVAQGVNLGSKFSRNSFKIYPN